MLLHSCPDTVHRFLLRKTQTSTPLIEGSSTSNTPRIGITPAVADCRYRAPLSPRLRTVDYIEFLIRCQAVKYNIIQEIFGNSCGKNGIII